MTARAQSVSKTRQDRVPFDAYLTPMPVAMAICKWLHAQGIGQSMVPNTPFRILEPSAGHGSFVTAAREIWPHAEIVANEIQPKLVPIPEMREYLLACGKAKKQGIKPELVDGSKNPRWPDEPIPSLDTRKVLRGAGATAVLTTDFLSLATGPDIAEAIPIPLTPFNLVLGNPPYTAGGGAAAHVAHAIEHLAPGGVAAQLLKMHFRGTEARIDFWAKYRKFFSCDPPIVPRPDFTGDGRDTVEYTLYCFHRQLENSHWKIHAAPAILCRKPTQKELESAK